jgi:hypothetical protein
MRSGSGAGTFFAVTYLLNAATLKPSFFAACRIENALIGNIVPDNLSDVKHSSRYKHVMAKDVMHISEAEAPGDFAALMARVRAGAEVVIEDGERRSGPSCRRAGVPQHLRVHRVGQSARGKNQQSPGPQSRPAKDVEEIVSHRKP